MQTTYEPMTARQREELRGYTSWFVRSGRVALYLLAVGLIGAGLRSVHHTFAKPYPIVAWDLWWLLPSLAFAVWLARKGKDWTGGRQGVKAIQADLADGSMAVHHISVTDAIEVEEGEDEGPSFFVLTAEGKVFYFHGQEMAGWKRKGFPWCEFEIREAPRSKMLFRLKRQGAPFPPSFVRKPMSYTDMKRFTGDFKGRYQLLEVDFESLKVESHLP